MFMIGASLLMLVTLISSVGMFHPWFKDNLLQRLGMACLALGSISMFHQVVSIGWMSNEDLTLVLGISFYSLGTWTKTIYYETRGKYCGQ